MMEFRDENFGLKANSQDVILPLVGAITVFFCKLYNRKLGRFISTLTAILGTQVQC